MNTCCRVSPAAAKPCRNSAAASGRAGPAKPSSKPIAEAFSAASISSSAILILCAACAASSASAARRFPVPTVALVGYTNAGKSTLFNAITGAQVLSSARMFATLDPKLRAIELPSRRRVLLSDTVGFIRNLPHTLVTSFRATLEEVAQAEVLLHIRDASSTYGEEQKAQVEKVLGELESLSKPRIEVLNKIDLLPEDERAALLARTKSCPKGQRPGRPRCQRLPAKAFRLCSRLSTPRSTPIPLSMPSCAFLSTKARCSPPLRLGWSIHSRDYEGNLVRLSVSGPASLVGRMRRFRARERSDRSVSAKGYIFRL